MFITNWAELDALAVNEGKTLADLREEQKRIREKIAIADTIRERGRLSAGVLSEKIRLADILREKEAFILRMMQE